MLSDELADLTAALECLAVVIPVQRTLDKTNDTMPDAEKEFSFNYEVLFDEIKTFADGDTDIRTILIDYIETQTEPLKIPKNTISEINKKLDLYVKVLRQKWKICHRSTTRLLENNKAWLKQTISFSVPIPEAQAEEYDQNEEPSTPSGRPLNDAFNSLSLSAKRKRTKSIRDAYSADELLFSAILASRASGRIEVASLIEEILNMDQNSQRKLLADIRIENPSKDGRAMDSLRLLIDASLSKNQYQLIRDFAVGKNSQIFAPYNDVRAAKELCYPDQQRIHVTETCSEVQLQALLNHTAHRIAESTFPTESSLMTTLLPTSRELILISKWGFDGATGQSTFKQSFSVEDASDKSIFITSLVPLQLYCIKDGGKEIVWQNAKPASVRFCRPIRLQFLKETTEILHEEKYYVESKIKELTPTVILLFEKSQQLKVKHKLVLTMIDGKAYNAINNTSSQTCAICHITPSNANKIDKIVERDITESALDYGLSPLHAYIRLYECVLHVSYRLEYKTWQARKPEEKDAVARKKAEIQRKLRQSLGLLVDIPREGGSGNTNDGNSARKFFANPNVAAEATGFCEDILTRFSTILQVINSNQEIDSDKFNDYALQTAKLFFQKYAWYPMPPAVHKILLHGHKVIEASILPIGMLTEEAQEARNKDIKKFRERHSRKCSRVECNTDVFFRLLLSSDPLISSKCKSKKVKRKELSPAAISLLKDASFSNALMP